MIGLIIYCVISYVIGYFACRNEAKHHMHAGDGNVMLLTWILSPMSIWIMLIVNIGRYSNLYKIFFRIK